MEKKTKLTISGSAKKSIKNIEIAKSKGKNSVVIEKQTGKFSSRGGSFRSSTNKPRITSTFKRGTQSNPSFNPKSPPITNDFEKRKLAEQRATKRLKGNIENKDRKTSWMSTDSRNSVGSRGNDVKCPVALPPPQTPVGVSAVTCVSFEGGV